MIEVDRAMIEDLHIELIQMMENAGQRLAVLSRQMLEQTNRGRRITILCGTGNNGGGGLTAARHLHNWDMQVSVVLTKSHEKYHGIPAHQLDILRRMQVPTLSSPSQENPEPADLILDCILGYSVTGDPYGAAAEMIRWANSQDSPILALDLPSGLDPISGQPGKPSIRATATLTLALPKTGLLNPKAEAHVGKLYLADIGVPRELYLQMGIQVPVLFKQADIVRIT